MNPRPTVLAHVAILVAVMAMLVLHQAYVTRVQPDVLYMDSLRLLTHLHEWREGRMSLVDMWGVGTSAHRGLVTQAFLLANVSWFDLDVELANRATGAVIAAVGTALGACFVLDAQAVSARRDAVARMAVAGLAMLFAVLGFSLAGFELLTLDLGLPLWFKNLCFLGYFIAHSRHLGRPGRFGASVLSACGVPLVLLIGMGWSYAFAGAVSGVALLHAWRGRPGAPAVHFAPSITLLLALGIYNVAGGGTGDGVGAGGATSVASLPRVVWQTLHALGSAFVSIDVVQHGQLPMWAAPLAGGLVSVAAMLGALWWTLGRLPSSPLPLHLVAYGVLMAVSVSVARGQFGDSAVMASRYYMDVYLATVGVVWLGAAYWLSVRASRAVGVGLAAAVCVLLVVQVVAQRVQWGIAPYRAAGFAAMESMILEGAIGREEAAALQAKPRFARSGVRVMRAWRVSTFAGVPVEKPCDEGAIRRGDGWHAAETGGTWMSARAHVRVPSCRCPLVIALFVPEGFAARQLTITGTGATTQRVALVAGSPVNVALPGAEEPRNYRLELDRSTVPSRDVGGPDARELGAFVTGMRFSCVVGQAVR